MEVVSNGGQLNRTDFYVAPGGEAIPAVYESWIGENQRDAVLEMVEDPELERVLRDVYISGSAIGDGSIVARIGFYKSIGEEQVLLDDYIQAYRSTIKLERMLNTFNLTASDRRVASELYNALMRLGG